MKVLHNLTRLGLLLVLVLCCSGALLAQRTVKGKVTDSENGEGLIGATVVVVGTTRGASTDIDGNFSVEVPEGAGQIRFAYTGYAETVVTLGASNVLEIALKPGSVLDEVVVVGYGSQKKRDVSGAVTSVSADEFNRGAIVSPQQLLQGKAAGVQITQSSGEPGGGVNVQIRGVGTLRSGSEPLYVVDGVPITGATTSANNANVGFGDATARNPLNFLNPEDIEKIDILKDASAAAIYGARGANGVILITTKKGVAGKTTANYSGYYGISNAARTIELLDGPAFVAATDALYGGAAKNVAVEQQFRNNNTDWQDAILRSAATQQHNVSFSGGAGKMSYYASLGYFDQEGIIEKSRSRRYTGRFNMNQKALKDRLTFSLNLSASQTRDNGVPISNNVGFEGDLIISALRGNPTSPIRTADGKFFDPPGNSKTNPVQFIDVFNSTGVGNRVLANAMTSFEILPGLKFTNNLSVDNITNQAETVMSPNPIGFSASGNFTYFNSNFTSRLVENYLNYSITKGIHDVQLLAGHSFQTFVERNRGQTLRDFASSSISPLYNPAVANDRTAAPFGGAQDNELQSFFGRVQYGLMDGKYQITATMRADGSTRFGADNKYGYFPSFNVGWRLSQESFMKDVSWLDDLKLRAGWGQTGVQEVPNRQTVASYFSNNGIAAFINGGNTPVLGIGIGRTPNPTLKWETSTQTNIGLDAIFSNGLVTATINWFNRVSTDALLDLPSKLVSPTERTWQNLTGNIINRGMEFEIGLNPIRKKDFRWTVNLNATTVKSLVEDMPFSQVTTGGLSGQGLTGAFAQVIRNGEALNSYLLFDFQGFDDKGFNKFRDVNGDNAFTEADKIIAGRSLPNFFWGALNTFSFGKVDFNFFFRGTHGFKVYNNTANAVFSKSSLSSGGNATAEYANSAESLSNTPSPSTRFLEKGDFVRLDNASLGYTLGFGRDKWFSDVRIYVTGQNLALFTDYTGYDPEVNIPKALNGVSSFGIDYSAYPRARTFMFGLNANF
jgi:TonB-dependent starch-binding outer membrane protein SusC